MHIYDNIIREEVLCKCMHTHSTVSIKYEPVAKSAKSKLSILPSVDNPMYHNKAAKPLKMFGIQHKQAV